METSRYSEPARYALQPGYRPATRPLASARDCRQSVVDTLVGRRFFIDDALQRLLASAHVLGTVAVWLVETLRSGHKLLVVGNGGSAAEAQHFVAELVGRFKLERAPYAAIALTSDSAILTAVANDYGYQEVFARQVVALGEPGDLLLAFSTSGESENVLRAAWAGRQRDLQVVAVTGSQPNHLETLADLTVHVPGSDTALVQELHMMVTHILCDIVEQQLSSEAGFHKENEREPFMMALGDQS